MHEIIKTYLSQHRYDHCVRVSNLAVQLASFYNSNIDFANTAGLIHDIAKELSPNILQENFLLSSTNYELDIYQKFPKTWHAVVAPKVIIHLFKCNQAEVLEACRWHTTGKADMSILEKIVFVSDALEPGRDFEKVEELRTLVYEDLDLVVYLLSQLTVNTLRAKKLAVSPDSLDCLKYYEKRNLKRNAKIISQFFS